MLGIKERISPNLLSDFTNSWSECELLAPGYAKVFIDMTGKILFSPCHTVVYFKYSEDGPFQYFKKVFKVNLNFAFSRFLTSSTLVNVLP